MSLLPTHRIKTKIIKRCQKSLSCGTYFFFIVSIYWYSYIPVSSTLFFSHSLCEQQPINTISKQHTHLSICYCDCLNNYHMHVSQAGSNPLTALTGHLKGHKVRTAIVDLTAHYTSIDSLRDPLQRWINFSLPSMFMWKYLPISVSCPKLINPRYSLCSHGRRLLAIRFNVSLKFLNQAVEILVSLVGFWEDRLPQDALMPAWCLWNFKIKRHFFLPITL